MPDPVVSSEAKPDKMSLGAMIRWLAGLAIFAWVLRSLIVAPFSIPTGSMLPTMAIGDYLFVSKWPYGFSRFSFPAQVPSFSGRVFASLPARGDVVIFKRPDAEGADWVKRVIGLPGDTVAMRGGVLILNGRPVTKQSVGTVTADVTPNSPCRFDPAANPCTYAAFRETLPGGRSYLTFDQVDGGPADDFGPQRVTAGHLFLMGDNRDDSRDSRFSLDEGGVGLVPTERLVGRAAIAFWSTDGSASYWKPWTWFSALRWGRIGTSYQP
jgi:signal peptidase I